MIKYKYALDQAHKLISIMKLAKEKRGMGEKYICIECGRRLNARAILSDKVTAHFYHYDQGITKNECGGEGYLHWISKELLAESFRENLPFYLQWESTSKCPQENAFSHCTKQTTSRIDLLSHYPQAHVEKRDGEYIPDISLHNEHGEKVYIEIFQSSKMSHEKRNSGKKIIEIKVTCEKDIEEIIAKRLIKEEDSKVEVINMDSHGHKFDCQGSCLYKPSQAYHLNTPTKKHTPKETFSLTNATEQFLSHIRKVRGSFTKKSLITINGMIPFYEDMHKNINMQLRYGIEDFIQIHKEDDLHFVGCYGNYYCIAYIGLYYLAYTVEDGRIIPLPVRDGVSFYNLSKKLREYAKKEGESLF